MLTGDAFGAVSGEMDRLRADSLRPAGGDVKSPRKDAQTGQTGNSFPEMLESMQNAMDRASGTGTEAGRETENRHPVSKTDKEQGNLTGAGKDRDAAGQDAAADAGIFPPPVQERPVPVFDGKDGVLAADVLPEENSAENSLVSVLPDNPADVLAGTENLPGTKPASARSQKPETAAGADTASGTAEHLPAVSAGTAGETRSAFRLTVKETETAGAAEQPEQTAESGKQNRAEEKTQDAVLSVLDLRRAGNREAAELAAEKFSLDGNAAVPEIRPDAKAETEPEFFSFAADGGRNSFADNGGFSFRGSSPVSPSGSMTEAASAPSAPFAEKLAAELRSHAADLVRAGQIVLRDGGQGTLRLTLHPETLGQVRIHLELSGERKLSGRISVSSREAWEAFSGSMDSLVQAFAEEGFDTQGFDLSWSGTDGSGYAPDGKISAPFYASSVPDVMPEPEVSDNQTASLRTFRRGGLYAVDVFA